METQKHGKSHGEHLYTADEIMAIDSLAADWTEPEVMAFIANCFDRDILLKTLLGYASNWLSTRMIAVLTKAGLQPFLMEDLPGSLEPENEPQHLRALRAPYHPTDTNAASAELTITPIDISGLEPLYDLLALPAPDLIAVQPVQVVTKTVLLLFGEPKNMTPGETPLARDMASLNAAAIAIGNQLEEVISHAKLGTLPPVEDRIPALPHPLHTPRSTSVVVEELTNALIAQSEKPSNPIDDGWLDMLENPAPSESQTAPSDAEQSAPEHVDETPDENEQPQEHVISPAPVLPHHQEDTEKPTHTLELFPDVLQDLSTSGKTITRGFETLSEDLSEPELDSGSEPETPETQQKDQEKDQEKDQQTEQHNVSIQDEHDRPTHTLELFIIDDRFTKTAEKPAPNKTLSGGFEAAKRDAQEKPETPSDSQPTSDNKQSDVPNARVLRRMTPTPKSFKTFNEQVVQQPETQPNVSVKDGPAHTSPTGFDLQSYQKVFPGHLLIDRYQHTLQSMPPVHEHGPLLAEIVEIGTPALELIRTFISSNSIELRFYAVLLLAEMPVHNLLEEVVERLFDRDQQIRALAQKIVLKARLDTNFERIVVQRMRHEIITNLEEIRVEVAAEIIGAIQDSHSIPLLIEALGEHRMRIQLVIQDTLIRLTFQDLAPSISEWRRWWQTAQHQPRTTWLIDALNSPNEAIRHAAFNQIQQIPGLNLNYHPNQPPKLRERAQHDLAHWFENF